MFTLKERIQTSHLGRNKKIRLSRLLDIIQDVCLIQLEHCEVSQEYFNRCNATTFIIYWQIDLVGEIRYGQELSVTTFVYNMKKSYGDRNVVITDEDGNVLVKAACGGANVDKETGSICPMPKDLLSIYPLEQKLDMEYLSRKIHFPVNSTVTKPAPLTVTKSKLDYNGHVNNARYLDFCEDVLPDDLDISRFIISYINPAKLGEKIIPVVHENEDVIGVDLQREDGESYIKALFYKVK